jgi:transcription antitermination factor NusG
MKEIPAWYIFYTYPRSEKKVSDTLISHGYEVYLPLKQEIHYWKNRQKKLISTPLFPNYIFVRASRSQIYRVLKLPKIVRYISYNSLPSTISSEEIALIKNTLVSGTDISLESNILSGKKARIITGPFSGMEGILFERKGRNRFLIQISKIPSNLSIEADIDNVEILASA